MADRSKGDGALDNSYRRKTPDEMLQAIAKLSRGRFKVYIGAVSGAGKTYHMLREGQALQSQGIDVLASAISTKGRTETLKQLGDLNRWPSMHWTTDNGVHKKDLDMEGLLARNPEVLLVDGLAHRNRPGAARPTRLEDIRCLLAAGISVITTVNVYELADIKDMAQKLTGIEAEEIVPAGTLDLADEVRLIDVAPQTLLKRIGNGVAGDSFAAKRLRLGHLGKLRGLALRLMAGDANASLEKHRISEGVSGPSGAVERILVAVQYHWNGSIYIRRGEQIARRLKGELLIVSFADPNKRLSKEAAAFKRSAMHLADKIHAAFEEVALSNRRRFPSALVRYAASHGVTRIVLGHSKQSLWQEWWRGSIVNGVLRHARRTTDVFFMADRADHAGERILPARNRTREEILYRRPGPAEAQRQIDRIRHGRLKIYIGAAPGVGKTYAMLREGNDLLREGIDVVIGLLETHGRSDTAAQVGRLESLPKTEMAYHGTKLYEMNVSAIIARAPEVVLVDELAHTNVPGSPHRKRYEDVMTLLEAGISVISTLNVQHLESLNDTVEQIAGVRVRETVPDGMLHLADEVELIDVAPNALRQRMRDGKIYAAHQVAQALGHFFRKGNLIALRELALREIADDVDERLESWERPRGKRGKPECIFVAVSAGTGAERLIRRGFRIAHRLRAEWHVIHVQMEKHASDDHLRRLEALKQLTGSLGGQFRVLPAQAWREVPNTILSDALAQGSTQVIIGHSERTLWPMRFRHSVVKTLLRNGRQMDLLVVSEAEGRGRMRTD